MKSAVSMAVMLLACGTRAEPHAKPVDLPQPSPSATPTASAPTHHELSPSEVAAAIQVVGSERVIPESGRGAVTFAVDQLMESVFAAADQNATSKELRIMGVRAGSIPDALGFRNGDVLFSIDDLRVGYTFTYTDASASSAKETWSRAWRGKGFTVKLRRAGQLVELRYRFAGATDQ